MEKTQKLANLYVASLKAIYTIHQHNHWTTNGAGFYEQHLLFERLYQSAQESADLAAEKMVGLFGVESVDYKLQNELSAKIFSRYDSVSDDHLALSLKAEKDFLKYSEDLYNQLKEMGKMTQGLDDCILSIASKREEACYLLQQASA
jgi:DNA-binding ferritin-like protein